MFKTYSSSSRLPLARDKPPEGARICEIGLLEYSGWGEFSMMPSSNGNIFRVTGHLCGESPVSGEVPAQRPVARSFDIFFDLRLNKRLSKQSWSWWFETLSCPLWRQCDEVNAMAADGQLPGQIIRSPANKLLLVTTEPWLPGCRISNSCAVVNWQKCQYSFQVSSKWFSKWEIIDNVIIDKNAH